MAPLILAEPPPGDGFIEPQTEFPSASRRDCINSRTARAREFFHGAMPGTSLEECAQKDASSRMNAAFSAENPEKPFWNLFFAPAFMLLISTENYASPRNIPASQDTTSGLIQILYVSSAVEPFTQSDLMELLEKSRANNAGVGVTGLLLFRDGNFIQVLEGPEASVMAIFAKVSLNPRHAGIITLLKQPIAEREFPDWSMGFRNLDDPAVLAHPGFNEFMNLPFGELAATRDISKARRLLSVFKNITR